tara:strand:- start:14 stop:283 length:270 start_codon:yes stop_codon:yes gene_type:complete
MAGLFSKPKAPPPPPGPDPELVRRQAEQEARLEAQERDAAREISARKRAARRGGARQLIFGMRDDPYMGIPEDTTFGPSYSREQSGRTS